MKVIPEVVDFQSFNLTFKFKSVTKINCDASTFKLINYYLKNLYSIELEFSDKPDIDISIDNSLIDEEYQIEIGEESVSIFAGSKEASIFAIQTIIQSIQKDEDGCYLQCGILKDYPKMDWRGLHLDVARHMYTMDEIKKIIDILGLLKFNKLHLHLTDDQGWRIEIKKYPKLTEIGGYRESTLLGHLDDKPKKFDGKKYGGYYTQEELKELVEYAQERAISIVPEIDMPGHMMAAISAYPEYGCSIDPLSPLTYWGVSDNILKITEPTMNFLKDVLQEVIAIFPGEYVHIGGDEVPKKEWEENPEIQQLMKDKFIDNESDLQGWFTDEMVKYLKSLGKKTVLWNEALESTVKSEYTVMSWTSSKPGIEAAEEGKKVIMCDKQYLYLDHYQLKNSDNHPLAIGGYNPLSKVYSYTDFYEALTDEVKDNIIGFQGNIWTEYMTSFDLLCYMAFPRIMAISELCWSQKEKMNWEHFNRKLTKFNKILDNFNIGSCEEIQ